MKKENSEKGTKMKKEVMEWSLNVWCGVLEFG